MAYIIYKVIKSALASKKAVIAMGYVKTAVLLILAAIMGTISPASAETPLSQSAGQFVDHFWTAWSGPNPTALPSVEFAITDPIDFYGKPISRDAYMKLQEAFANRWPVRQYSVVPDSEQINCNQAALSCDVTGTLTWQNFDPARKVTSVGTAKFDLSLRELADQQGDLTGFAIDAMSGSDIDHSLVQAPPDAAIIKTVPGGGNFVTAPRDPDDDDTNKIVSDAALQNAGCASNDGEMLAHQDCQSLAELDLTKAFHTAKRTVFETTQSTDVQHSDDPPALNFCFFQKEKAQCQYNSNQDWGWPNQFSDVSLVYPETGAYYPLLHAHTFWCCGFGCGGAFNFIWAYDPATDLFKLIWRRPYDCHTALKFETKGPLAGDIIAVDNNVTSKWPWPYGIEVYKFIPPDQLTKILYLVGRAGQGGKYASGPNDAINIDMPEILKNSGISK